MRRRAGPRRVDATRYLAAALGVARSCKFLDAAREDSRGITGRESDRRAILM